MKTTDLLNKIPNGEMEEAIFYVAGDFFYNLIVIDENLYVINTSSKQLELLESKYICRFIRDNIELIRLDNFEKILEETKIPEKLEGIDSLFKIEQDLDLKGFLTWQKSNNKIIENKINEIIDYLKSKGDE